MMQVQHKKSTPYTAWRQSLWNCWTENPTRCTRREIDQYMLRHIVKPGITGWAQINGWRGETDTPDKMKKRIEFDLHYIRNWSIILDIKIIFLTIFKGFVNKNAYWCFYIEINNRYLFSSNQIKTNGNA